MYPITTNMIIFDILVVGLHFHNLLNESLVYLAVVFLAAQICNPVVLQLKVL